MVMNIPIDISYDFRKDTPPGRDPDIYSLTLRQYHKLLWGKRLPSGHWFHLVDSRQGVYLHHQSELGEYFLSSDSATHTFSRWKSMAPIIERIPPQEIEAFRTLGYTIGGFIVFPSNRIDNKPTMNGARGLHHLIKDRMDLTLECIRRYYQNEPSPLSDAIGRYGKFFSLFQTFRGYVEFFLLQDLVTDDFGAVDFLMEFNDFSGPVVPKTLETYLLYKDKTENFVRNRSRRMAEYFYEVELSQQVSNQ